MCKYGYDIFPDHLKTNFTGWTKKQTKIRWSHLTKSSCQYPIDYLNIWWLDVTFWLMLHPLPHSQEYCDAVNTKILFLNLCWNAFPGHGTFFFFSCNVCNINSLAQFVCTYREKVATETAIVTGNLWSNKQDNNNYPLQVDPFCAHAKCVWFRSHLNIWYSWAICSDNGRKKGKKN